MALNWALGQLSLWKVGLLLLLAIHGRTWMYWVFMGASAVDRALAKASPGLRRCVGGMDGGVREAGGVVWCGGVGGVGWVARWVAG